MPVGRTTCLAFALSLLARAAVGSECLGSVYGEGCTKLCRCKSSSELCFNHNGRCPGDCAWSYGSFNCQQYNAALFKRVNMTGEKFFPGTGTELKHLTGDKAVDNDFSTDLSRCALAYRFDGTDVLTMTIDMGQPVRINHITLLGVDQDHPLKSRLQLELDDQVCFQRDLPFAPPQKEDVTCEKDMMGRILKLTSFHKMIKLCELQVWECTAGMFGNRCDRECLCKNPEEACDRWTGKCHSGCRLAHRQANCQERNVALVRKCQQSSFRPTTSDTPGGFCQYAVDGLHSTTIGFCAETRNSQGAGWIQVDLGMNRYVTLIEILGHQTHKSRLNGLVVKVDGTLCAEFNRNHASETLVHIRCSSAIYGRVVRIERKSTNQNDKELTICELEVWECADGSWGPECKYSCNCKDSKEVCHKVTGACKSDCPPGFKGTDCQEECEPSTFGMQCRGTCHCYEDQAVCRPSDGNCSIGCAPGWIGSGCSEPCAKDRYGIGCDFDCPSCTTDGNDLYPCDARSGACQNCTLNSDGMSCRTKCEEGQFGKDCWVTCNCKEDNDCHEITGVCRKGCKDGWYGANCQMQDVAREPDVTFFDHTRRPLNYLSDGKLKDVCTSLRGRGAFIKITLVKVTYINRIVLFTPRARAAEAKNSERYRLSVDNKDCADRFELLQERVEVKCSEHLKGIEIIIRGEGGTIEICEVQVYECARYMWGYECKHQCNCAISTDECNRHNGTCDEHCDSRFRGASCQIENMALNKPTRQSSLFYHDESHSLQYSFHAVDGNDDPSAGKCAVTQSLGESWWEVDLLSHAFINRITILGQKYSTFTKMSLHIEVDGEVCFQRDNAVRPSVQEDVFCTHDVIGQIVRFMDPKEIVLCEVKIWECIDGTWGTDCDGACNCQDDNEICNKFNGKCVAKVDFYKYDVIGRAAALTASRAHAVRPYRLLSQILFVICIRAVNTWTATKLQP